MNVPNVNPESASEHRRKDWQQTELNAERYRDLALAATRNLDDSVKNLHLHPSFTEIFEAQILRYTSLAMMEYARLEWLRDSRSRVRLVPGLGYVLTI